MSDSDPKPTDQIRPDSTPAPPAATAAKPTLDSEPENEKDLRKEILNILRNIPFIGPYIVIIKLKWGWSGILLLIAGFSIATLLVFFGFFPSSAVSAKYKTSLPTGPDKNPNPPTVPEYELKAMAEVPWDTAVRNAKTRIWATGIALTKLNPQLISERVKERVDVQLAYVNPCGATVQQRMDDEHNPNASSNILGNLKRFDAYTKDFNAAQRESLKVKLSNVYPTMVVINIDSDIYAYFCPYGGECSNSPVLVFKNYKEKQPESAAAKFFEKQVEAVCDKGRRITNFKDPCSTAGPYTPEPTP
jgi:hypothetical protein